MVINVWSLGFRIFEAVTYIKNEQVCYLLSYRTKGPIFGPLMCIFFFILVHSLSRCTCECVKYVDLIEIVTLTLTGLTMRKGRNSNSVSGSR